MIGHEGAFRARTTEWLFETLLYTNSFVEISSGPHHSLLLACGAPQKRYPRLALCTEHPISPSGRVYCSSNTPSGWLVDNVNMG
jgi:hypothetical protein